MGIDPAGYQVSANVVTADGTRFPLWLRGAQKPSGESLFRGRSNIRDVPIVTAVEMEVNRGWGGTLSVSIAAPYEMGLELLNSELFVIGNRIEARMGYPLSGQFTPWFSVIATKPDLSLNAMDGLTATLKGQGGAFSASRSGEPTQYSGTYRDVITRIANRYGWDLDIPDVINDELDVDRGSFSQTVEHDWIFLQKMARAAGYDAMLIPSPTNPGATTLSVIRRTEVIASRPTKVFLARGNSDFDVTWPLLSFESQMEGTWMPQAAGRMASHDIHPDTREEEEAGVDPATEETPTTGDTLVEPGATEIGGHQTELRHEGVNQHVPVSRRNPMHPDRLLRAHSEEQQIQAALQVTITSFGIPDLMPDVTVALDGLGIFNGNYGIDGITHSASESDWTMSIKLLNNALFGDGVSANLARRATQPNTQRADVQPDAGGGGTDVEPEDDF